MGKSAMESNLKLLEGMIQGSPENYRLLAMAAQGYTGYALMFISETEKKKSIDIYKRAKTYGMRALSDADDRFTSKHLTFNEFKSLIDELEPEYIDAAFWTAMAWGNQINLDRSSPKSLAEFPRAKLLMEWVYKIDPGYFYSGPRWFLGNYYASLPPMFGGDIEKARSFFKDALEQDGEYFLFGKLFYAQSYAVQKLDRELYIETLNQIIEGANNEPEELKLMNRIAIVKAKQALDKADEIF